MRCMFGAAIGCAMGCDQGRPYLLCGHGLRPGVPLIRRRGRLIPRLNAFSASLGKAARYMLSTDFGDKHIAGAATRADPGAGGADRNA